MNNLQKGNLVQNQLASSCLSLNESHLRGSGSRLQDLPAAVQPPNGRFLGNADIDELRQAVFPVQEIRVL